MSQRKIKAPRLKSPNLAADFSKLPQLLQKAIETNELLVQENQKVQRENERLNQEVSRLLEEFDTRLKKIEQVPEVHDYLWLGEGS